MKIQCDVCEKAPATLICCADEAALCDMCDKEVHAANKLAGKHQRLLLETVSNKLPTCDICQEKPAFVFCVEDRAMFCQRCDEPIHPVGSLAANHQRFLATGIRVALNSKALNSKALTESLKSDIDPPPPNKNEQIPMGTPIQEVPRVTSPSWAPNKYEQIPMGTPIQEVPGITSPSWAVDDLLHLSDYDFPDKKEHLGFGELEWFSDIGLFGEHVSHETSAAAEVPRLPAYQSSNATSYRPTKYYNMPNKKPRIDIPDDDDEYFTVPDLG